MTRIGPRRYRVASGERINVDIKKSLGTYNATVSDVDNATWAPEPDEGIVGHFKSPQGANEEASFTALFDFVPGGDSDGDFYTITISGETGDPDAMTVDAPALQHRTYFFEVES